MLSSCTRTAVFSSHPWPRRESRYRLSLSKVLLSASVVYRSLFIPLSKLTKAGDERSLLLVQLSCSNSNGASREQQAKTKSSTGI